jgi:hypothetical protein
MKTKKRESVIDEIIESRVDTCMSDNFYLPGILEHGFVGFANMNDKELEEEYWNEFNEDVKITII